MNDLEIFEILSSIYAGFKIYGPYIGSDGRARVVFKEMMEGKTSKAGKTFSMAWARAKMTAKRGFKLGEEEEVDHIDEDPTNDDFKNLQILQDTEHRKKSVKNAPQCQSKRTLERCPSCGEFFSCRVFRKKIANKKGRQPCCSRSCSSKLYIDPSTKFQRLLPLPLKEDVD